jgi:antitoxin VapB
MLAYPIDISHSISHIAIMNAPSKIEKGKTTVFKLNRSQAVRIPKDLAFPEEVKKLIVRRDGNKLILEPESTFWDDFFDRPPCPDYPDRAPQGEYEVRESFDV